MRAALPDTQTLTDKGLLAEAARTTNRLWNWTAVGTAALLGVVLLVGLMAKEKTFIPETLIGTVVGLWYALLGAKSGIARYSFKDFRDSDHEALRIKASASVPATQTTVEKGGVVQQANVPPRPSGQQETQ